MRVAGCKPGIANGKEPSVDTLGEQIKKQRTNEARRELDDVAEALREVGWEVEVDHNARAYQVRARAEGQDLNLAYPFPQKRVGKLYIVDGRGPEGRTVLFEKAPSPGWAKRFAGHKGSPARHRRRLCDQSGYW